MSVVCSLQSWMHISMAREDFKKCCLGRGMMAHAFNPSVVYILLSCIRMVREMGKVLYVFIKYIVMLSVVLRGEETR